MAMPQCCYLAKGAKRPSHTTNTIKFDRIPFDTCNSIKRFDLSFRPEKFDLFTATRHNGHIYGVKKQETNDELNQTFPKTSINVHDKQESFDVPVVFIHSQVQILLKIHWEDPVSQGCSHVFILTEQTFYNIGS